jgi:hypothetical protein
VRSIEAERLRSDDLGSNSWKHWGPYLSERQWGTVREDYSASGTAWEYLSHDHARSRAYRWGEDGLAGFSDAEQRLCVSLALWNERDPILKERLFGLTNSEGNHGEDVKELYYYLDATPTHSYLRMLYKYPQAAFPYQRLVEENRQRGIGAPEFELLDTGVFGDERYFDVFVEYAQVSPGDILLRITAHNRGPSAAPLHVLPGVCFRNTWSWNGTQEKPRLSRVGGTCIAAAHATLGEYYVHCDGAPTILFCDNESNAPLLWGASASTAYPKDSINARVVNSDADAVSPAGSGTKAAAWYRSEVAANGTREVCIRISRDQLQQPFEEFTSLLARRREEADEFYGSLQIGIESEDARLVQRQAFAGMIWSKQYYYFDIPEWLRGDPAQPPPPRERRR